MAKKRKIRSQPPVPRTQSTKPQPSKSRPTPTPPLGTSPPAAVAPPARVRSQPIASGPTQPAFWFGFEVSWAKLAIARVVIFGLLAIDAVLAIAHAPRYRAGDFNVGHLPIFEAIAPGRVGYELGQLACAYLFVLAMFGVATRWVVPIGAAFYAWLYFGSQLDSYQHHYLVALVLGIASFIPWQRPDDVGPATPVRSWALRLLLVQLAIVYLWAAISKLDAAWLDGTTLGKQMTGSLRAAVDRTIGIQAASIAVIVVELALAVMIWLPRTWKIAAPLGIAFHIGIASTGLEIGLFAYLMIGFYILVVPDVVWTTIATSGFGAWLRDVIERIAGIRHAAAMGVAVLAGIGLAALTRFEFALHAALAATVVTLVLAVRNRRAAVGLGAIVVAHVFAIALWCVVDRAADVGPAYYRFWGGSQRRLGDFDTAERAYRRLIEVDANEPAGPYQLGRLLLDDRSAKPRTETPEQKAARQTEGLAALREAQRLEPARARAWIAEARWHATQGRQDDAVARARQAVAAEPSHREARQLLKSLLEARPAPPVPADAD